MGRRLLNRIGSILLAVGAAGCGLVPGLARWETVEHDWALLGIDGPRLELEILVGSGSCDRYRRVEVEETADTVLVSALVDEARGNVACTDDLNVQHETVVLAAPLGDRTLIGCDEAPDGYYNSVTDRDSCGTVLDHSP